VKKEREVKKKKNDENDYISESHSQQSKKRKDDPPPKDSELDTNIDNLKTRMLQHSQRIEQQATQMSQLQQNSNNLKNFIVVGQIFPSSKYVVSDGTTLFFCNQVRAKESLLFEELKMKFKPQTWCQLTPPIVISELSFTGIKIGDNIIEPITILNFLVENLENRLDFFERNGFKIQKEQEQLILTAIYAKIPNYSVTDLRDLLVQLFQIMKSKGNFDIKIRSKSIQNHIAEAVRQTCSTLNLDKISIKELQTLLEQLNDTHKCPHGKPIFEEFCNLDYYYINQNQIEKN